MDKSDIEEKLDNELQDTVSEFREKLIDLLKQEPSTVRDILSEKPSDFGVKGVYVISTPDDGDIIYVGKTRTKTINGRIEDHRYVDTTSDLKGMLDLFTDYPQEVDDYFVRCVEISDNRERTFFENFTIGILQPPFNK